MKVGDFEGRNSEYWDSRTWRLHCTAGWREEWRLFFTPTATVCSHDIFMRCAVPSTYPTGIKSQISLHYKDNFSLKKLWLFPALILHWTRVPIGQYRTCWQSTVVTACSDLLVLSAFNMKADGLFENSVHFYRSPWSHSQENNFGIRLLTSSYTTEAKNCGSSTLYRRYELWPHTDTQTLCEGTSAVQKKSEESKDSTDLPTFLAIDIYWVGKCSKQLALLYSSVLLNERSIVHQLFAVV